MPREVTMRVAIVMSLLVIGTGLGSDLTPAGQQTVPPFDVNEVVREVGANRVCGLPGAGEFLVDTTIVYKRAEFYQEAPASSFDGTNYFVVWQDMAMPNGTHGIFGARLSREGLLLDSAGTLISRGAYDHIEPSVAFDGLNYLVVWRRQRANGESCDVYGARISTAGIPIDTTGIPISAFDHLEIDPAVTFGGSYYLVVWEDYRNSQELYGARINRQGRVLDSFGIRISMSTDGNQHPAVGFNGSNYLVVWSERDSTANSYDIRGSRLDQNGVVLDTAAIPISNAPGSKYSPALTFDGVNYLVVWEDTRHGEDSFDIYGARVDQDGMLLDTSGLPIATTTNRQRIPSVDCNGTYCLVTWEEIGNSSDICGARVTRSGNVLDPAGIPISTSTIGAPSVVSDGSRWLTTWADSRIYGPYEDRNIYGSRIDPDGAVLDTAILVSSAASFQYWPAVSFDGTNYLVVWEDRRSPSGYYDIYGIRLGQSGNICDLAPIPISNEVKKQSHADVAFDGTNYLVVWEDDRYTYTDIYGARVSTAGVVIDQNGFPIATASYVQNDPSVAFGGLNYLVVWRDSRGSVPDIYGARVNSDGTVLDQLGIRLSSRVSSKWYPSVAFDGLNYFVVWADYDGYNIYGTRVSQAGQVLDPNGIPISCAGESQGDPSVTFGGSEYFVVWGDGRNGYDSIDVYGARVTPTGVVLDTGGIAIARAPYWQYEPVVVYDGANYVVLWTDRRNGWFTYDIRGARIDRDGAIIDSFIVSDQEGLQMSPRVALGMGNQVLSVYAGWTEIINRHRASTMRIWGKLLPAVGIREEARGEKVEAGFGLRIYPTPALSKRVRIQYTVPRAGKVKLAIYNAIGQMEEVLVDCETKEGVYTRTLSKNLASGVYFVRFASDDKSVTRKLVVVE